VIETPIYLTHTSLTNDFTSIGILPHRFVVLQLSEAFSLSLICDPSLDLTELFKVFSHLFFVTLVSVGSERHDLG